jgi:hypothetical protein
MALTWVQKRVNNRGHFDVNFKGSEFTPPGPLMRIVKCGRLPPKWMPQTTR